jgi:hypothetical protein
MFMVMTVLETLELDLVETPSPLWLPSKIQDL